MERPDWMTDPRVLAVVPGPEVWTYDIAWDDWNAGSWTVGAARVGYVSGDRRLHIHVTHDGDPAATIATIARMLRAEELERERDAARADVDALCDERAVWASRCGVDPADWMEGAEAAEGWWRCLERWVADGAVLEEWGDRDEGTVPAIIARLRESGDREMRGRLDAESRAEALLIELDDLRTALVDAAVDRRDLDAGVREVDVPPCPVCGEPWCWGLPVRPGSVCRAYCDRHDRQLGPWLVRAEDGDVVALPAGRMPHRQRADALAHQLVAVQGEVARLRHHVEAAEEVRDALRVELEAADWLTIHHMTPEQLDEELRAEEPHASVEATEAMRALRRVLGSYSATRGRIEAMDAHDRRGLLAVLRQLEVPHGE